MRMGEALHKIVQLTVAAAVTHTAADYLVYWLCFRVHKGCKTSLFRLTVCSPPVGPKDYKTYRLIAFYTATQKSKLLSVILPLESPINGTTTCKSG